MPSSVHVEVLRRAAEILGGKAALRAWLGVSMRQLDYWMQGAGRPPTYAFLKAVDLISAESDPGATEALRRSIELRRKAALINRAARAARDNADDALRNAASAIERSKAIRAWLLEQGEQEGPPPARLRDMSVEQFTATEFGRSDGRLIIDSALRAAVQNTAASRGTLQLVCPAGLRIVGQLGFDRPFLEFFAIVKARTPSCCDQALKLAQRIIVADVRTDPIFAGTESGDVMLHAGSLACQSTPLLDHSDQVIGVLSTHYDGPHQPSSKELEIIDRVSQRASFWLGGRSL